MHLQTTSANHKFLGFLQKHGFRVLAERPAAFYNTWGRAHVRNVVFGKLFNS